MTGPVAPVESGSQDVLDTPAAGPAAIRGSALRMAAYVGGIVLTLVSAPLLVRHLGVVDFGRYVLVNTILILFAGVVDAGLISIAQREYVARTGDDRARTMANLLGIRLTLTGAAVLVAIAFVAIAGYGSTLVLGTVAAGSALMLVATQHMAITPLIGNLRYGAVTAIDVLGQVGNVTLIITLVLVGSSLLPFFAVGILTAGLGLAVTVALVRGSIPLRPRFNRGEWWELMRDALPYAAAAAVTALYFRLALVVLSMVATDLVTGYYATAYRVFEIALGVPAMLVSAAFPVLTRAADTDAERLRYQIGRIYEVALILGLWFTVGLIIGAPFIIDVLTGGGADPSVEVLRVQAPAVIATFFAVASAFPLLALRRHKEVLVANLAALLAGTVSLAVLAPAGGAVGTAIATGIAETVLAITMTAQLLRARPELQLPLRTLPVALGLAGLAACALVLPVHPVVQAVVATAVYFGGLALTGRLPEELAHALLRRGAR